MGDNQLVRRGKLLRRIAEQEEWIRGCGGTLSGYVARYGSRRDEEHAGDGGEAIFAADKAALDELLAQLG